MWVLLSSRLRTWLLLAVAVPMFRVVVRRASVAASRRNPGSAAAGVLRSLETALARFDRRRSRR